MSSALYVSFVLSVRNRKGGKNTKTIDTLFCAVIPLHLTLSAVTGYLDLEPIFSSRSFLDELSGDLGSTIS